MNQTEKNLSYYINEEKNLPQLQNNPLKISILSSFTVNGLSETLKVKCFEKDIPSVTYSGGYKQYNQEILDPKSGLNSFEPEILFIILDPRTLFGDFFYSYHPNEITSRKKAVDEKILEIKNLCMKFLENHNCKIIISNLNIPYASQFGICSSKINFDVKEMISKFNEELQKLFFNDSNIFIHDFNSYVHKYGEKNVFNYKQFFVGDIQVSFDYIPKLANEFLGYILPLRSKNKKCIVLDLDNTLWGGVVGEDGFNGIHLGPTKPGNSYVEFQKRLLSLHERGIILAINSKNNYDDAIEVINNHPSMILREKHFGCIKINWNDKISNLKEISSELNIGLDSLVFLDDDAFNCEIVQKALPEIHTIHLPNDSSQYVDILLELQDFNVLQITNEDFSRGKLYTTERKRTELKQSTTSIDKYMEDLQQEIILKNANEFSIPRISQLTLKTNQFNLTTKRYQESDINKMDSDKNFVIGTAQVIDKFGDSGISGVFIIKKTPSEWFLDTFL